MTSGWQVSHPIFAPQTGATIMAHVSITPRQALGFVERAEIWIAEWRQLAREVAAQAELERKLRGVDSHLLRDMGLEWSGRRLEKIVRDDFR
jgi:hypothetical protein